MKAEYSIVNIVTSAILNERLDLSHIAKELPAEYDPTSFPGVIYQIQNPRASFLLFSSGKMICAGTKNIQDANTAIKKVTSRLQQIGINVASLKIDVQNIVSTGDLHGFIDLEETAKTLEKTIYEPEQFPGLIVKWPDPKVAFLLFSSGRFVCAGAKREEEIKKAVEALENKLEEETLILYL
jgi:transcription initiation factor TFIID TATA-box-binding protein